MLSSTNFMEAFLVRTVRATRENGSFRCKQQRLHAHFRAVHPLPHHASSRIQSASRRLTVTLKETLATALLIPLVSYKTSTSTSNAVRMPVGLTSHHVELQHRRCNAEPTGFVHAASNYERRPSKCSSHTIIHSNPELTTLRQRHRKEPTCGQTTRPVHGLSEGTCKREELGESIETHYGSSCSCVRHCKHTPNVCVVAPCDMIP